MSSKVEHANDQFEVDRYEVQYPVSAYTFPSEARIHRVRFDDERLHIELTDGRIIAIPLWWIPTLYNASSEEREKYEINRSRTMISWDPGKCAIVDEVRVTDYLGPCDESVQSQDESNGK
jgi:hypothetical protein